MRRAVLAAVAAAAALAAPAGHATNECDNFQSCIPVAGPWVALAPPTAAQPFPMARWYLRCPIGVVGGTDAQVTDRSIDVVFPGYTGAPVNPGITTTNELLFQGTYTGTARKWTTYRPFIGCIPRGGGQRTPTSYSANPQPPGRPTVLRVRTFVLRPGRLLRVAHSCRAGERMISAWHAVGFRTLQPPTAAELSAVRVVSVRRGNQLLLSAARRGLAPSIRVEVQAQALCTRAEAGP